VDGSLRNHVRKLFKKQVIDNAEITEGWTKAKKIFKINCNILQEIS
jgi:hypothetical protein